MSPPGSAAVRTCTHPPDGNSIFRSPSRTVAPGTLRAMPRRPRQPTAASGDVGATHHPRPPSTAAAVASPTARRVLPVRRPASTTRKRASDTATSACHGKKPVSR